MCSNCYRRIEDARLRLQIKQFFAWKFKLKLKGRGNQEKSKAVLLVKHENPRAY